MGYEIIQTVGKYKYLYLVESYRDKSKSKDPLQKRIPIGKIDSKTGEKVYKPWYLEKLRDDGIQIEIDSTEAIFSIDDIKKSSVRNYGAFYLIHNIAKQIGVIDCVENVFPKHWQEIFMLSCYMIASGDPFMYCQDWLCENESLPVGKLSSQRISELLVAISPDDRNLFYQTWCNQRSEEEYLALDITSVSSYSELIDDVNWGYNRDHEHLAQINICMLMGETSRLPIYQSIYEGSLKDVKTLETTLAQFDAITKGKPVLAVMDKGFFSKENVNRLLGDKEHKSIRFIISVSFTTNFAKEQVKNERNSIDRVENTIVINGDSMRAVTRERVWKEDKKVYTHIYYNAKKGNAIKENLFAKVALLHEEIEREPEKYIQSKKHLKYINITKLENKYTISIRNEVIEEELNTAGWVVIISNDIANAKKAMQIYRDKDVVEKGFLKLKNNIDLGRLRVHSQESVENKVFIGFIALTIMSEINRIMSEKRLYQQYTMKELIKLVGKQKIQEINNQQIIYPITKEQRLIYETFKLAIPM